MQNNLIRVGNQSPETQMSMTQNILSSSPVLIESLSSGVAPVLIWIADHKGLIQFLEGDLPFNIEMAPGKAAGKSLFKVFSDYPAIIENLKAALGGTPGSAVTENASQHWEWRFYPFKSNRKEPRGVVGIAFDYSFQQELWHKGALMDAAAALRQASTREDMPPLIIGELRQQLDVDQAVLVLGSPPEHPFELHSAWSREGQSCEKDHILAWVLADQQLIDQLNAGETDQKYYPPELKAAGLIGFPLITNDEVLGALWVGRQEPFSEVELRLIEGIAEMSASAFQRAGQHELTRLRLERLAALRAIDQAISGSFNLNLTLHIILEQVASQLNVDAADVFLVDPVSLEATYAEGWGFQRYKPRAGATRARDSLVWRVLKERELVAIPDLYKESPTSFRGRMFALEGFRSYYGIPLIAKGKILGVLEVFHRKPLQVDEEWFDFLRALGTQAAIAMDNAALVENLRRSNIELDLAYSTTLEGWVRALDLRDKTTGDHTHRVVERTLKLAQAVDIPDKQLIHIRRGALLHDIGKLVVPDSILNKEGPLTKEERALIEKHPIYAREMLEPIEFLRPALPIPYAHHEKWDGTGYPDRISGDHIPLPARVFALIDVWDALSSPRPYREAWNQEKIYKYIREESGSHFDPQIVEAWKKVFQIRI